MGGSNGSLSLGQPLYATQRQPVELGTVLCDESDFWDKRNQMKNAEYLVAAMKHERKEE